VLVFGTISHRGADARIEDYLDILCSMPRQYGLVWLSFRYGVVLERAY
jgi:hypothetical protein